MSSITQLLPNIRRRLTISPGAQYSVGIDVGSRAMKFVQLQKVRSDWRMASKWIVNYPGVATWSKPELLTGALDEIKSQMSLLHDLFKGRKASVALSMSNVEMCNFLLPQSESDEMGLIVREELCNELNETGENLQYDYWQCPKYSSDAEGNSRLIALAMERQLTMQIVKHLQEVGWEPQILDGVPCAIARAVQIVDDDLTTVAALDLGYTSPILTICKSGQVIFCRRLMNCGLQHFVQAIQRELSTTLEESQMLLTKYGLAIIEHTKGINLGRSPINTIVANCLEHLAEELERTMAYFVRIYPKMVPTRCWMFGGGTSVKNLRQFLEYRLQMPTRIWSLDYQTDVETANPDGQNEDLDSKNRIGNDALFGVAAGLSLLTAEDA